MPTLWKLSRSGVFFESHHPVLFSSTEVNGAALATGSHPRRTGIIANQEYRPEIELLRAIETKSDLAAREGDRLRGGLYMQVPTLAEIVRQSGRRTAVAGTKGVTLLWDRGGRDAASAENGVAVFEGNTLPTAVSEYGPKGRWADGAHS